MKYEKWSNWLQPPEKTTLKNPHSDIKKYQHYFDCCLEFLEAFHSTNLDKIPLIDQIDLAWIFHCFCAKVFVLFSAIKRENCLIVGNFHTRYIGRICFIADFGKWISRKFLKDHWFFDLENYSAKLNCSDIDYIRAMQRCFRTLPNI